MAGNFRHGHHRRDFRSPEYVTWVNMISRCYNPDNVEFHRYGVRGIAVCQRWRDSFEAFLADMGKLPGPTYQIERRNNDQDYGPDNCEWATRKQQARNRRSNRLHTGLYGWPRSC